MTSPTWVDLVNATCLAAADAFDRGYAAGWRDAQEAAEQGATNRQISRVAVANIGTEVARAKADNRAPRLYAAARGWTA